MLGGGEGQARSAGDLACLQQYQQRRQQEQQEQVQRQVGPPAAHLARGAHGL
jgi:hypothetical protein